MSTYRLPMRRRIPTGKELTGPIIAYDLETTRIPTLRGDERSAAEIEQIAREQYESERLTYDRFAGVVIMPDLIRRRGRWKVRGEFLDVPARFLRRNTRRSRGDERIGDVDEIAGDLGLDAGELLDTLRTLRRPSLAACRAWAQRFAPAAGDVTPKFLTAFGAGGSLARRCASYRELGALLCDHFLLEAHAGSRFVAWNANRFDVRLVMEGLIAYTDRFTISPFVAKQSGLRGVRVDREKCSWLFLDGMAMLGLSCSLRDFLQAFAPNFPKGTLDFDNVEFNADNSEHVAYALRDAEGLYHGLSAADKVLKGLTGRGVQSTIGNAGIKAFVAELPAGVDVFALNKNADGEMRRVLVRGGYVYVKRQYDGAAWSYDLNQAYAAAMRDQDLPCGYAARTRRYEPDLLGAYVVELWREQVAPLPFYLRDLEGHAHENFGEPILTQLCTPELDLLAAHGWRFRVVRGTAWSDRFRMRAFVDRLEAIRKKSAAGSPLNLLVKAIGNNAYGKMNEQIPPFRYLIARTAPAGALPYDPDDPRSAHIWVLHDETDQRKWYHRPQVAAFITAHVRCKVFAAAMLAPDAFLKADTDSVTFSRPVDLPISSWEYGKWKCESEGVRHIILGKKCYAKCSDPPVFVCKGLHVRRLSIDHYVRWLERGEAPVQEQMQLQTWKRGLRPTFRPQTRTGTNFA